MIARQATRASDRLVEGGVDPTVGGNLGNQPFAVGAAQLLELAITQQRVDELGPLVAQLLERGRIGGIARLGLLGRREAALLEKDAPELSR